MDTEMTLQEVLVPHYVRLGFGGFITMPDGLDYNYKDLSLLAGNGRELTFNQFVEWVDEYSQRPGCHFMQMSLFDDLEDCFES